MNAERSCHEQIARIEVTVLRVLGRHRSMARDASELRRVHAELQTFLEAQRAALPARDRRRLARLYRTLARKMASSPGVRGRVARSLSRLGYSLGIGR